MKKVRKKKRSQSKFNFHGKEKYEMDLAVVEPMTPPLFSLHNTRFIYKIKWPVDQSIAISVSRRRWVQQVCAEMELVAMVIPQPHIRRVPTADGQEPFFSVLCPEFSWKKSLKISFRPVKRIEATFSCPSLWRCTDSVVMTLTRLLRDFCFYQVLMYKWQSKGEMRNIKLILFEFPLFENKFTS